VGELGCGGAGGAGLLDDLDVVVPSDYGLEGEVDVAVRNQEQG
jgi:hypothetical protein